MSNSTLIFFILNTLEILNNWLFLHFSVELLIWSEKFLSGKSPLSFSFISSHFMAHWDQLLMNHFPWPLPQTFVLVKLFKLVLPFFLSHHKWCCIHFVYKQSEFILIDVFHPYTERFKDLGKLKFSDGCLVLAQANFQYCLSCLQKY